MDLSQLEELKKLSIVVVDDADFSRKSIVDLLEEEGYNIVGQACNAAEALQLAHSVNPNCFLIDIVMPEISGLELAKKIAKSTMGIYLILMSSLNTEQIVIESISSGAIDFLQKPFDKNTLLKSVEKVKNELLKEG